MQMNEHSRAPVKAVDGVSHYSDSLPGRWLAGPTSSSQEIAHYLRQMADGIASGEVTVESAEIANCASDDELIFQSLTLNYCSATQRRQSA